jgi:hypothetical protein
MPYQEEFFDTNIVKLRRTFPPLHLWRIPGIAFEWRKILFSFIFVNTIFSLMRVLEPGFLSFSSEFVPRDISTFSAEMQHQILEKLFLLWKMFVFFDFATAGNIKPSASSAFIGCCFVITWSMSGLYLMGLNALDFTSGRPGTFLDGIKIFRRTLLNYFYLVIFAVVISSILQTCKYVFGYGVDHVSTFVFMPIFFLLTTIFLLFGWIYANSSIVLCSLVADNSDPFDAFGRTYSYVVNHIGYTILLIILGVLVCCFSIWIFSLLVSLLVIIQEDSINYKRELINYSWLYSFDQLVRVQAELLNLSTFVDFQRRALLPHHANHDLLFGNLKMLVLAAANSLFWTTSAVIYFLLRHTEDGTPLNEMYRPISKAPDTGVPLVGIAERERAMQRQPASPPPAVVD